MKTTEATFLIRNSNWTLENLRNNFTQKVWDLHTEYVKDTPLFI